MIHQAPVNDAVGASAVVADDAAHHGPAAAGRVGPHHEPVAAQITVYSIQSAPRLHLDSALLGVDVNDMIQIFGEIYDHRLVHCLPGQAGTTPAGQDGQIVLDAGGNSGQHILLGFGDDHSQRHHFVDGGVGAVEDAGGKIGFDLSGAALAQGVGKILNSFRSGFHCITPFSSFLRRPISPLRPQGE